MKINPKDIVVTLDKKVEVKNGVVEVSLSRKSEEVSRAFQEFVANYLNTVENSTLKEAAEQFDRFSSQILETSESGELTPAQKKLPPAIQKAILKKMDKPSDTKEHEEKETEEEEDAEEGKESKEKKEKK